jgi:hypothetical protein
LFEEWIDTPGHGRIYRKKVMAFDLTDSVFATVLAGSKTRDYFRRQQIPENLVAESAVPYSLLALKIMAKCFEINDHAKYF